MDMELIKSSRVSYFYDDIKTPSIDNEYLKAFDFFYNFNRYYNEDKYIEHTLSILDEIKNKEQYIISEFYKKSDKNKLCLFKDKGYRKDLNNAIYNESIDKHSLLSLIRFYYFLPKENIKYNLYIRNNIFVLDIRNKKNVLLQLRFLDNGNVDFLSLDEDPIAEDDCKTYVLKGTFSTSEYLDKSYKIKRLLNILYE
ncbi:hypothetical protein Q7526_07530 [Glaesserella parasuis]|nr:hypothetical protein [Glaesserella parasuis]MDP0342057.1 hypothetical protein [Glaesserella parasuis]MDP0357874.1 hypothetical protein [Glaesserella parasuis]